jgi:excisionase family DNA binding protein
LLTVREVAALLGFGSEDPVRRLVRSGRLRAHKVSGRIRISRGAVDELLAASVVEPVARPVPRCGWRPRRRGGCRLRVGACCRGSGAGGQGRPHDPVQDDRRRPAVGDRRLHHGPGVDGRQAIALRTLRSKRSALARRRRHRATAGRRSTTGSKWRSARHSTLCAAPVRLGLLGRSVPRDRGAAAMPLRLACTYRGGAR